MFVAEKQAEPTAHSRMTQRHIYSWGAQFKGTKSTLLFFACMGLIVWIVLSVIREEYWTIVAILPFLAIGLVFMADIQGVEVDRTQNRIRVYRRFPWGRKGEWQDLRPYTKVTLNQASYNISTSDLTTGGAETFLEKHQHFVIELVNTHNQTALLLGERSDMQAAKDLLDAAGKQLNLPTENIFIERYKAMLLRRN